MYNYNVTTTPSFDSNALGVGLGVGTTLFTMILFIIIGLIILGFVLFEMYAMSLLFKKAGKPAWAAFVPIYNNIVKLDIIGYKWYYVFALFANGVPGIGPVITTLFNVTSGIKFAKAYGKEVGFGVGVALAGAIFIPIMAFDKKTNYVGQTVNGDIDFNDLF